MGREATWTDDDDVNWVRLHARWVYQRKVGTFTMKTPSDETVAAVRQALAQGQRVLLAGGPSGSYTHKITRDDRFIHMVSTETGHKVDHAFVVPGNVGVVLLTRLMAAQLTSRIIDQCKVRHIPHYGVYRSTGGVQRTLDLALAMPPLVNATDAADAEETEAEQKLRQVDQALLNGSGYKTHPPEHARVAPVPTPPPYKAPEPLVLRAHAEPVPPPAPAPAPSTHIPTIDEVKRLFADVRAGLDLAEEQVIKVLVEQSTALAAVDKLRRLQELLK